MQAGIEWKGEGEEEKLNAKSDILVTSRRRSQWRARTGGTLEPDTCTKIKTEKKMKEIEMNWETVKERLGLPVEPVTGLASPARRPLTHITATKQKHFQSEEVRWEGEEYGRMDGWMDVYPSVSLSVCMYVCTECMYACMYACMYIQNVWMDVCLSVCAYVCIDVCQYKQRDIDSKYVPALTMKFCSLHPKPSMISCLCASVTSSTLAPRHSGWCHLSITRCPRPQELPPVCRYV